MLLRGQAVLRRGLPDAGGTLVAMRRGCGCLFSAPILIFGLVFTAAGAGFFLLGRGPQNAVETTGIVVDLVANTSSDGTTYAPVIEFSPSSGVVVEFQSNISRSPSPRIGDTVAVLYNPLDPSDAIEKSTFFGVVFLLIFLGIGLVAVFFGVRLLIRGGPKILERAIENTVPGMLGEPDASSQSDTPHQSSGPTSGAPATAQFRRVEPRGPDEHGAFQFRVVARGPDGQRYYSEWLDEDPTTAMLQAGVQDVPLELKDGVVMVVDFLP